MNWILLAEICYVIFLVLVCLRIIYDTRSTTKALAYLLLVIFLPVLGILFYLSLGTNYRKRKIYNKKITGTDKQVKKLKEEILKYSKKSFAEGGDALESNKELATMLVRESMSVLTAGNEVKLLVNGETKFPEVVAALEQATNHIHIQYYIYEDDEIGKTIENLLIRKARDGVTVRFIFDDFGSRKIRHKLVPRLQQAGVKVFPFYKVRFWAFANRINYRNHRKIIIVDGRVGFVGGINVSDRYINPSSGKKRLFWRDTHLRIEGPGVMPLQHIFLNDWNFCANDDLAPTEQFFPKPGSLPLKDNKIVQIAASGPDSDMPTILFSLLQAINLASEEILITTPYFIPGESILDALIISALGGVSVKLLVPGISDSKLVNAAARSYYGDLLDAGVEIYLYQKGFVHAKSMVTDKKIAIVGSANMDNRSFDLNFEVNAIVYNEETAAELADIFYKDLEEAEKIDIKKWKARSWNKRLGERTARLISPLL
ncbi:MAG: cardiolipin synthase [Chitinophagaceae bacterium]